VARTVNVLADACIPVFLVVLGMQLVGAGIRARAAPLALAVVLRMGGGLLLALPAALFCGLEGPARQAGLLQAAMPSAVICTILASEYEVEPTFVTSVVFLSTLLSPLLLTPLLAYLGA
jgi:predicted permease